MPASSGRAAWDKAQLLALTKQSGFGACQRRGF
jgi:hypothetical protein